MQFLNPAPYDKRVVLTGCFSFIGNELVKTLQNQNKRYYIYAIDKLTRASESTFQMMEGKAFYQERPEDRFVNDDICSLKYLPNCDYVINVAAESHVSNSIEDCSEFIQTNVNGVRNLLDIIRRMPVSLRPLFIHFSTDEVYGDIEKGSFNEESPMAPSNPYAASKCAADLLIMSYARTYGIKYVIVRPTNNFGIGQYNEKLIPLYINSVKSGKKLPLHNGGNPIRTWCHKSDTASAVMHIINIHQQSPNTVENQIYNISSNFELKNIEILEQINDIIYGEDVKSPDVDMSYDRPGQDVRYSIDTSKLQNLGWFPETRKNFKSLLKETVDYYVLYDKAW